MPNGPPAVRTPALIVDDVASGADDIPDRMRSASIVTGLVVPGAGRLDCLFMIAGYTPAVLVMVVTATGYLLLKAAGELGETYGRSGLACVANPVGLATVTAFVARSGVSFKLPRQNLH
jgi:hypothetical protein